MSACERCNYINRVFGGGLCAGCFKDRSKAHTASGDALDALAVDYMGVQRGTGESDDELRARAVVKMRATTERSRAHFYGEMGYPTPTYISDPVGPTDAHHRLLTQFKARLPNYDVSWDDHALTVERTRTFDTFNGHSETRTLRAVHGAWSGDDFAEFEKYCFEVLS